MPSTPGLLYITKELEVWVSAHDNVIVQMLYFLRRAYFCIIYIPFKSIFYSKGRIKSNLFPVFSVPQMLVFPSSRGC